MSTRTDNTAGKTPNNLIGNYQEQSCRPALITLLATDNLRGLTEDTMSDLEAELHRFIVDVRSIPDDLATSSILSKKSLLQNLRNASIKLHLAWSQLESRGKTSRYYQYLLACREYLEKACKQYEIVIESKGDAEQVRLTAIRQGNEVKSSIKSLPMQEQISYKLTNTQQLFQQIYDLFNSEDEIWPDQCNQAISNLHSANRPIQNVLELLNESLELPPGTSPLSYELIGKVYQLDEQMSTLTSLITSLRPLCQTKSKQVIRIKENILCKLDTLHKTYNTFLPHINIFINKYPLLKRKYTTRHHLTLIKSSQ